jgi:hypothetical protein
MITLECKNTTKRPIPKVAKNDVVNPPNISQPETKSGSASNGCKRSFNNLPNISGNGVNTNIALCLVFVFYQL